MKNLKLISVCLLVFAACIGFSCNKEKLTKATKTGANTFSCLVDGIVFKPSPPVDPFIGGTIYNLRIHNSLAHDFQISASNDTKNYMDIIIYLPYVTSAKQYLLANPSYGQDGRTNFIEIRSGSTTRGIYRTDSLHTGIVNITRCDLGNGIYSGTFSFEVVNEIGSVIKVTKGRFDVKQ